MKVNMKLEEDVREIMKRLGLGHFGLDLDVSEGEPDSEGSWVYGEVNSRLYYREDKMPMVEVNVVLYKDKIEDHNLRTAISASISHNIGHVMFHHLPFRDKEDQIELMAKDLSVNSYIPSWTDGHMSDWNVDTGPFPHSYGLPKFLSWEEYYEILENNAEPQEDNSSDHSPDTSDHGQEDEEESGEEPEQDDSQEDGEEGKGEDSKEEDEGGNEDDNEDGGSEGGEGEEEDGEGADSEDKDGDDKDGDDKDGDDKDGGGDADNDGEEEKESSGQGNQDGGQEGGQEGDQEDGGGQREKDEDSKSERNQQDNLRREISEGDKEENDGVSQGEDSYNDPYTVKDAVSTYEIGSIDVPSQLRKRAHRTASQGKFVKNTWLRKNRRFDKFPGHRRQAAEAMAYIDQSGSMGADLPSIAVEILWSLRDELDFQGVTTFASHLRDTAPFNKKQIDEIITGGYGGTNFREIFDDCREKRIAQAFVFTDMQYNNWPEEAPDTDIVWVDVSGTIFSNNSQWELPDWALDRIIPAFKVIKQIREKMK